MSESKKPSNRLEIESKPTQREIRDSHIQMPALRTLPVPEEKDYVSVGLSEIDGNPFIEIFGQFILGVPSFLDDTLAKLPLPPANGATLLRNPVLMGVRMASLSRAVYPTIYLAQLNMKVLGVLSEGYQLLNPLHSRDFNAVVHTLTNLSPAEVWRLVEPIPDVNTPCFLLMGASGMGKSFGLHYILNQLPRAVRHKSYRGQPMNHVQVVWLYCQCPPTGTLMGLLLEILARLDLVLGTNYFRTWSNARLKVDVLIIKVCLILRAHSLGVLVLDELQHLKARSDAETELNLNFFVALLNFLRIPIISVGTYKTLDVLVGTVRDARRMSSAGTLDFARYGKNDRIMRLQHEYYLSYMPGAQPQQKTQAFYDRIYDIHQGFQFLLPNLVQRCSVEASFRGDTHVTDSVLAHYEERELKPIAKVLRDLRNGDLDAMSRHEDAISPDELEALRSFQTREDSKRTEGAASARKPAAARSVFTQPEFPDHQISDSEILVQCKATKELLSSGHNVYNALSQAGLVAQEIAYGRLPA